MKQNRWKPSKPIQPNSKKNSDKREVYRLKYIKHFAAAVEAQNPKATIDQCHRCQPQPQLFMHAHVTPLCEVRRKPSNHRLQQTTKQADKVCKLHERPVRFIQKVPQIPKKNRQSYSKYSQGRPVICFSSWRTCKLHTATQPRCYHYHKPNSTILAASKSSCTVIPSKLTTVLKKWTPSALKTAYWNANSIAH